jgi:hypothetical protein
LSLEDQEFVNAIDVGERMMMPVSPAAVTSEDPDSPSAVAKIAANYSASNPAAADPPAVATVASSPASEFGGIDWYTQAIAEIDAMDVEAPATTPSPKKRPAEGIGNDAGMTTPSPNKRRKRDNGPGSSTWNRRLGCNALPSPLRVTVQEPFGRGQVNRASEIMAHIMENGTPKQLVTATGTAKAFQREWNRRESGALINQQPSMGGYMTPGVAQQLVRTVSRRQVEHLADSMPPLLPNATPPMRPTKRLSKGPKPKPKLDNVPIEDLTREHLEACSAKHLYHLIIVYSQQPGMPRIHRPSKKVDRVNALL